MRHLSTYGPRARLGLIVPPTNTVNESEWSRLIPEGVTFHTHRMALHTDSASPEGAERLSADLEAVFALLGQCGPDVIAYACTAGSMVTPADSLPAELARRTGRTAVTTAAAIVAALRALGVKRLSVATPYAQALNDHEAHFLAAHGFEVVRLIGLGIGAGGPQEYPMIARKPLAEVRDHALAAFVPGSDALLITCTDFPSLPLVAELERDLGVPVVTSNTATLWKALREAGIADDLPAGGAVFSR
ncbi:MAG: aspartate/glutamate racemase family protein [Rhodobacteraceae bacterium]|nr:aspartate/glutamate racemase family protein [Paracoccaceae bacterium]